VSIPDESPAVRFTVASRTSPLKKTRIVAGYTLSALLGLFFIYSGYTKLWPLVEAFELTLVDAGVANWYVAPIMARLLIGMEFFTGVCLFAGFRLRRFTLPLTSVLLIAFNIHLAITVMRNGNTYNCGCFGEHIIMSPGKAIVKNFILLGITGMIALCVKGRPFQGKRWIPALLLIITFSLPFMINVVDYNYTSNNIDGKTGYRLPLELLYASEDSTRVQRPAVELREGKHVVSLMTLGCPHFRLAARKFRIIKEHHPHMPVYLVLNGDASMLPVFFKDTGAEFIPHSMCLGKTFVALSSVHLPAIYYVNNSIVDRKVYYTEMSEEGILEWLAD
jgi:uncharacterized membrane protein YphA (DoxX/SURF4 family)